MKGGYEQGSGSTSRELWRDSRKATKKYLLPRTEREGGIITHSPSTCFLSDCNALFGASTHFSKGETGKGNIQGGPSLPAQETCGWITV